MCVKPKRPTIRRISPSSLQIVLPMISVSLLWQKGWTTEEQRMLECAAAFLKFERTTFDGPDVYHTLASYLQSFLRTCLNRPVGRCFHAVLYFRSNSNSDLESL